MLLDHPHRPRLHLGADLLGMTHPLPHKEAASGPDASGLWPVGFAVPGGPSNPYLAGLGGEPARCKGGDLLAPRWLGVRVELLDRLLPGNPAARSSARTRRGARRPHGRACRCVICALTRGRAGGPAARNAASECVRRRGVASGFGSRARVEERRRCFAKVPGSRMSAMCCCPGNISCRASGVRLRPAPTRPWPGPCFPRRSRAGRDPDRRCLLPVQSGLSLA